MTIDRPQHSSEQRGTQSLERREQGSALYRTSPLWGWGGDLFSMNPFSMMRAMTDEMDRAFSSWATTGQRRGSAIQNWAPALDVREKEGKLMVSADLPGLDKKDLKVEVANDTLVIQGERKQEHEESRGEYYRSERSFGQFYRSIPLPEGAKSDQVRAEFQNGVLTVTVPIDQAKTNRRQIEIK